MLRMLTTAAMRLVSQLMLTSRGRQGSESVVHDATTVAAVLPC